jgi:hypothetical protein
VSCLRKLSVSCKRELARLSHDQYPISLDKYRTTAFISGLPSGFWFQHISNMSRHAAKTCWRDGSRLPCEPSASGRDPFTTSMITMLCMGMLKKGMTDVHIYGTSTASVLTGYFRTHTTWFQQRRSWSGAKSNTNLESDHRKAVHVARLCQLR